MGRFPRGKGGDRLSVFATVAAQVEEKVDPLRAAIDAIDADALSPRDALDHIYRLKQLAASERAD